MNNVIVTGANGFLGTWLVKKLSEEGKLVIAVLKDEYEDKHGLDSVKNVQIIYCKMDCYEKLPDLIHSSDIPDTIYHLAWAGTSGSERSDYQMQLENVGYTLDIINAAAKIGCKRFVGAGTLAEKDCLEYIQLDDSTPNPVAHYGVAKIATQFMSKIECQKNRMEYVWGIFSNIYGVGNTTNNFVNFAIKSMLKKQDAEFTSGEQLYDFVYVEDFIHALYLIGEKGENNRSYFLGSGSPRKLKEYIFMIRDAIDPDIPLFLGRIPFNGISLSEEEISCNKLSIDTGYRAKVGFKEGIELTVDWLRSNID